MGSAESKDVVVRALSELFGRRDPAAVERFVAPGYVQHSAVSADGPGPLRRLVSNLGEDFAYDAVRVLADGDLVVAHGVYTGLGPDPIVAFDLYRVEDGRLAEHWDALIPRAQSTVSGRTQTDGPARVVRPEQTGASRARATEFVRTVLIGGAYDRLPEFVDGENYAQHNPGIGDGLSGFGDAVAAMSERGLALRYDVLHRVVAEGEFAFAQSEGDLGGRPYRFYDLFRFADGRIVEHWDVMAEVPAALPHGNGAF